MVMGGGKRKKDEGEATDDVEEERSGNPSNKKRQILPSSIKNKEKRSAIHAKIKHEKKLEKKKKSKAREIAVKKALELGEELPPKQVPRTIENTREFDETVCKPDDEEICQMCDQELHVASDCRWVYSSCKVDNCDGIRLLLTSKTSINNGRKFLRCQFSGCSGFQWLDEAIAELNEPILTLNEHRGCCGCGSTSHVLKECPWKSSSCPKKGCNGIRDLKTSTQGLTLGRKFFKCKKCGKFDWFSSHTDEVNKCSKCEKRKFEQGKSVMVKIDLPLDDFCEESINQNII